MRRQLVQVLESNVEDMFEEVALRCFWSMPGAHPAVPRTPPDPEPKGREAEPASALREARVVDLAQWKWRHVKSARPQS